MLKQRLLTALWGVPLVVAIVWFGDPWFTISVAVTALLAVGEFYRMAATKGRPLIYLGMLWTLLFIISPHFEYYPLVPALLTSAIIISLIWLILRRQREEAFSGWVWTIAGILYVGWLLSYMVALRDLASGRDWVFLVLLTTFASDTAAYFAGANWGKHYLAPTISPKKTWEGAAAGVIAALIASTLLVAFFGLPLNYGLALLLGLLVSVFGQFGDLAKSMLKRNAGLKDSGKLFPGHGGMLDRIDSILFATIVVYYFVWLHSAGWLS